MGLYQHSGYKRLAAGIPVAVFVLSFLILDSLGEQFEDCLIGAFIFSAIAYALIRITYWIIDGFQKS